MKAWREELAAMREKMDAGHKEMVAEIKTETDVKTMACRETTETRLEKEPTSADRKPEVAQQGDVRKKDAIVMPARELKKKRRRDRISAARKMRERMSTEED
jgi:hypothetical protein